MTKLFMKNYSVVRYFVLSISECLNHSEMMVCFSLYQINFLLYVFFLFSFVWVEGGVFFKYLLIV